MLADALFGQRADARMDDRFEFFSRGRIVENDRAEFLPVESAVRLAALSVPKALTISVQASWLGLDHFARQDIGVDDRRAEARENFRNRAFSRGDAAG